MGISNDIKPRKVYHPHKKHFSEPKKSDLSKLVKNEDSKFEEDEQIDEVEIEKKEALEDQFFDEEENENSFDIKDEKTKPEEKDIKVFFRVFTPKRLTWFFAFLILAIVIYQNFNDIKSNLKMDVTSDIATSQPTTTATPPRETAETTTTAETPVAETPAAAATTTPAATTSTKAAIALKVLNGNGISGSGERIAATLTAAGYTVSKTANAKSFIYLKTYIYYKTGKEAEATQVKADLPNQECVVEKSDSATTGYDIVVVVGKK